jgi:transposase InsO family protein
LKNFFRFYNEQRPHSAFGNAEPMTPMQVYRRDQRHALSA